jgi:hypothetical protein
MDGFIAPFSEEEQLLDSRFQAEFACFSLIDLRRIVIVVTADPAIQREKKATL